MPGPALQSNYGIYFGSGAALAAALFLPGWCVQRRFSQWYLARPECLPLPGLILLTMGGLASWQWHPGRLATIEAAAGTAAALLVLALTPSRPCLANRPDLRSVLPAYAALVLSTAMASAIRQPVAQDFWAGTSLQSPLPASPPDSAIPYRSAAYLWDPAPHPRDRARSETYFWTGWSVRSRGPLVPLVILATFPFSSPHLQEGGGPGPGPWPAAPDGYFAARWITLLLNATVVFGAFAVWRVLRADTVSLRFGLAWLTLAPAVWFNTAFGWPKLLATYFLLLAAASILESERAGARFRDLRIGALLAAGYLSHPVGALFAPPLLVMHGWRRRSDPLALPYTAFTGLICAGPWLALQFAGPLPNVFLRYPAGDGHGLSRAVTIGSWLRARWNNVWFTLAPAAWFFSSRMLEWSDGPLSPPARWAVQAAKTLPAGIGFSMLALPLRARRAPGGLLLAGGLALALLCWGYSDDGLGRNCLEPLTVGVIVWAAAGRPASASAARWLLCLLGVETMATLAMAYAGANGFSLVAISFSDRLLFLAAGSVLAAPWAFFPVATADARSNLTAQCQKHSW